MSHPRFRILIGILPICFVIGSVLIPSTIQQREELTRVSFGYPLSFIAQNRDSRDYPSFPVNVSISSPWEYPTQIQWISFVVDLLIVGALLVLCQKLISKRQR
jgi:hypothetical protein